MAPLMPIVATGMPGGICTIDSRASWPSSEELIGTPITGIDVMAAITPGSAAAMPAAAIITLMPRSRAVRENSSTCAGVRWALRAVALALGIISVFAIDMAYGSPAVTGWFAAMGDGIGSMGGLITVTLLAGGMLEVIRHGGGIDYLLGAMSRHVSGRRGAALAIAALVSVANICTANNTIAIITVGNLAADISRRFGLEPRRVASLLDTFSCVIQGILPYGAQLLMAGSLAMLSPLAIIGSLYYPMALAVCALASILLMRK